MRIAYLLSQYPAISHTFLLKEVEGLRALGLDLETASINPPDRPLDQLHEPELSAALSTTYIKSGSALSLLLNAFLQAVLHPIALLRGLRCILTLSRASLRERLQWLFYLGEALLLARWLRQSNLHHLHIHFGGPVASVGLLASVGFGIPFSLTIHGPEELLNVDAYRLREKLLAAKFVVAISDFCRSQVLRWLPPAHLTPATRHRGPSLSYRLPKRISCVREIRTDRPPAEPTKL